MRLTGVIFDWAGTVVDHGSRAPVATLQTVFGNAGVPVTVAEARLSMGIAKREHVRQLLSLPRVAGEWRARHGAAPGEADLDRLYAEFIPTQLACLGSHSDVIRGVPEAVAAIRARGLGVGSCTGYTRPMLDFILEIAKGQGFEPDAAICPEDVPGGGRPGPWMCYLNAIRMRTAPLWAMVKIGDTPSDIAEGRNAGMWTIGITRTGNEVGLTAAEWEAAPEGDLGALLARAAARLNAERPHYLAESVPECLPLLDEIEGRLAAGERP